MKIWEIKLEKVSFNTQILKWGMERYDITAETLENKFPNIRYWLTGDKCPTFRQLEELAKSIYLPFGYFFLSKPPKVKLALPLYRSKKEVGSEKKISPQLYDTIRSMQRRQIWLSDYLKDNGVKALPFVATAKITDDPVHVANLIYKALSLKHDWAASLPNWSSALNSLRSAICESGIVYVGNGVVDNNTHRTLRVDEFRGFVLVDPYAPLIFVNHADCLAARMFTLAHELAHVIFGSSAAFDLRDLQPAEVKIELACNKVAAEFLLPTAILTSITEHFTVDNETFKLLAKRFKVSEIVVARRLLDCEMISKGQFMGFYKDYCERQKPEPGLAKSSGDFYNNQEVRVGRQFMKMLLYALNDNKVQHTEAFKLTGLYGKTFYNYADKVMES